MKYNRNIIIALIALMIVNLSCGMLGGGSPDADEPTVTDASMLQEISTLEPAKEANPTKPVGKDSATEPEQEISAPESELEASIKEPEYQPGYEPGWQIFSNANFVNGLAFHDGVLWAATEGGVVAWDVENDQAAKYTTLDGMGHISAYDVVVCSMPDPTVVVATEKGLSLYDIASATWSTSPITPQDSYVADSKISELFCDPDNNRLLIGYYGLGVLDFVSSAWQRYLGEDGLAWDDVDDMTVAGSDIWTASYKGISVISPDGIQVHNEASGMPEESTNAIVVDATIEPLVGKTSLTLGGDNCIVKFQIPI